MHYYLFIYFFRSEDEGSVCTPAHRPKLEVHSEARTHGRVDVAVTIPADSANMALGCVRGQTIRGEHVVVFINRHAPAWFTPEHITRTWNATKLNTRNTMLLIK